MFQWKPGKPFSFFLIISYWKIDIGRILKIFESVGYRIVLNILGHRPIFKFTKKASMIPMILIGPFLWFFEWHIQSSPILKPELMKSFKLVVVDAIQYTYLYSIHSERCIVDATANLTRNWPFLKNELVPPHPQSIKIYASPLTSAYEY